MRRELFSLIAIALFFFITILVGTVTISPIAMGANNSTVISKVNVTATPPTLYAVSVIDSPINLVPGSTQEVICRGSVLDLNGWEDISYVNATFYDTSNGYNHSSSDDDNYHYTNSSCESCTQISTNNASCNCSFAVQYFANNATWECNMTVQDGDNLGSNKSAQGVINAQLAIGTPAEIDYGSKAAGEFSDEIETNITNYGNLPMNLTVYGYGGSDPVAGDNLSMICAIGNITLTNERYHPINGTPFNNMFNLSNTSTSIDGFNLAVRTNDSNVELGEDLNATYWMLEIPLSVSGFCNGTVVFSAVDAS